MTDNHELATLAGGCFWCLDAVYVQLDGVVDVVSGYTGGRLAAPSYEEVCTGLTGHAEVVQITFDPDNVSFKKILEVFFTIHDPTTLNRQGSDVGTQYRSGIFYHDEVQKQTAHRTIGEITKSQIWDQSIVTEVTEVGSFYEAEDYHQRYFSKNPDQPYCSVVVRPKVVKFRKKFLSDLRKDLM